MATLDELTSTFLVPPNASGLPKPYDDSKITPLIDGEAYNNALVTELAKVGTGSKDANAADKQFILIHNWWLGLDSTKYATSDGHGGLIFKEDSVYTTDGPRRYVEPAPNNGEIGGAAKLLDVIVEKAKAGVDVRVMGWITSGITEGAANAFAARVLNSVNASTLRSIELLRPELGMRAITNEIGHTVGSSHLKMVVIGNKINAVGFTGGLDFELSRWAQVFHPDYHISTDPNPQNELWHDVMAKVEGPAVAALYEWYSTIWKEVTGRDPVTYKLLRKVGTNTTVTSVVSHSMDRSNAGSPDVAAFPITGTVPSAGNHRVHSVRTSPQANFGEQVSHVTYSKELSYAPHGIFEFQAGIQKAISGASSYIYLEDQYLYSRDIMGYIHKRLLATDAPSTLKVILMTGGQDPHDQRQPLGYLASAMNALLNGIDGKSPLPQAAADRVRLYKRLTEFSLGIGKIDKATALGSGKYQLTLSTVPPGLVRGAPYKVNEIADEARMQVRVGSNVFPVVENPAIPAGGPYVLVVQPGAFDIFTLGFPQDGQDFELFVMNGITVHAKTTLIDDRCAIIGSANAQRRSLFTDIEHSVIYVDAGDEIRDYRTALWSDHFRHAPASDFNDIAASLAGWNGAWVSPGTAPRRPPHIIQVSLPINAPPLTDGQVLKYEAVTDADSRQRWGGMSEIQRIAALDGVSVGSGGGVGGSVGSGVQIEAVKLVRLVFHSAHGNLRDNNTDLTQSGNLFGKPEWAFGKPTLPITHTKNQPLEIEIDLDVSPADADRINCEVVGKATFGGIEFRLRLDLQGGTRRVQLTSTTALPDKIDKLTGNIAWTVDTQSSVGILSAGSSSGHTIYSTFGPPKDPPGREAGITQKRVETAVNLVKATGTLIPDDIIQSIMQNVFPAYTVTANPALQFLDHPRYFNSIGGAWRLSEHIAETGECQAIVRFVRACMLVLGAPGTFKVAIVFGDPDTGDALEDDQEQGGKGLTDVRRTFKGKEVFPALLSADPGPVGTVFQIGDALSINWYEACLKFSDVKPARYYPGGTGGAVFQDNIDAVIKVFKVLIWYSFATPDREKARVERIIRRYK